MSAEDAVRITSRDPAGSRGAPTRRGGGGGGTSRGEDGLPVSIELIVFLATAVLVLIACQIADSFDARLAWILITALAVSYILSRGLARRDVGHGADR